MSPHPRSRSHSPQRRAARARPSPSPTTCRLQRRVRRSRRARRAPFRSDPAASPREQSLPGPRHQSAGARRAESAGPRWQPFDCPSPDRDERSELRHHPAHPAARPSRHRSSGGFPRPGHAREPEPCSHLASTDHRPQRPPRSAGCRPPSSHAWCSASRHRGLSGSHPPAHRPPIRRPGRFRP